MAITGPIKGPISNIPPELREINLDKQEEEKSTQQPAGQISTADSIEAKTANTLADALEAGFDGVECAGFGSQHIGPVHFADTQRPEPIRITDSDERILGQ